MRHGAALHVLLPLAGTIARLAHAAGSTPASANKALTTAAAVMNSAKPRCAASDGHTCGQARSVKMGVMAAAT